MSGTGGDRDSDGVPTPSESNMENAVPALFTFIAEKGDKSLKKVQKRNPANIAVYTPIKAARNWLARLKEEGAISVTCKAIATGGLAVQMADETADAVEEVLEQVAGILRTVRLVLFRPGRKTLALVDFVIEACFFGLDVISMSRQGLFKVHIPTFASFRSNATALAWPLRRLVRRGWDVLFALAESSNVLVSRLGVFSMSLLCLVLAQSCIDAGGLEVLRKTAQSDDMTTQLGSLMGLWAIGLVDEYFDDVTGIVGRMKSDDDMLVRAGADVTYALLMAESIRDSLHSKDMLQQKEVISVNKSQKIRAGENPFLQREASARLDDKVVVEVLSAAGLRSADGIGTPSSDPYTEIHHNGRVHRTTHKHATVNPNWGETFVLSSYLSIEFDIRDFDRFSSDDSLGKAYVDTELVRSILGGHFNGWIPILDHKLRAGGELNVTVTTMADNVTVILHKAKGLRVEDPSGSSDPYVLVSFAGVTKKSRVIKKTTNPTWDENFKFDNYGDSYNAAKDRVALKVFDWDLVGDNDYLGECMLHWPPYNEEAMGPFKSPGVLREEQLVNSKNQTCGTLSFRLTWVSHSLHVLVVGASNIPAADKGVKALKRKSDPYCLVQCNGFYSRTKTCRNTSKPVWKNERFEYPILPPSPVVIVKVYDHDTLSFDDELGRTKLSTADLIAGGEEETDRWYPLDPVTGKKGGKIRLKSSYREDKLYVTVAQASGLDKSDPFCMIQYEDKKFRTDEVQDSSDPEWNADFVIPLQNHISISVMDKDSLSKDDVLGVATVDFSDLAPFSPKEIQSPLFYSGTPHTPAGSVTVRITFCPASVLTVDEDGLNVKFKDLNMPNQKWLLQRDGLNMLLKHNTAVKSGLESIISGQCTNGDKVWMFHQNGFLLSTAAEEEAKDAILDQVKSLVESPVPHRLYVNGMFMNNTVALHIDPKDNTLKQAPLERNSKTQLWMPDKHGYVQSISRAHDAKDMTAGTLSVRIIQARGLMVADFNGAADAFCRITVANELNGHVHTTKTIKGTHSPLWNETCTFQMPAFGPQTLLLDVYDYDAASTHDAIGFLEVPLGFGCNVDIDCDSKSWFKLEGHAWPNMVALRKLWTGRSNPECGNILLEITFTPAKDITKWDDQGLDDSIPDPTTPVPGNSEVAQRPRKRTC